MQARHEELVVKGRDVVNPHKKVGRTHGKISVFAVDVSVDTVEACYGVHRSDKPLRLKKS